MKKEIIALTAAAVAFSGATAQNLLPNPSFEESGPGFIIVDGWTSFTTPVEVAINGDPIPEGGGTFMAQDGDRGVLFTGGGLGLGNQFDTVWGVDFNNDSFEDRIPVTEGTAYVTSGWDYMPSSAPFVPLQGDGDTLFGNIFLSIVNFFNDAGDNLGAIVYPIYEGRTSEPGFRVPPTDQWNQWESDPMVAPPGAVEAQYIFVLVTFGDPAGYSYIDNVYFGEPMGTPGCNDADLAEPYGTLDLADITAFISAFTAQDPAADLAEPFGTFDLADITAFITAFNAGCP